MDVQIQAKEIQQINRTSVLQQTAFWSKVKLKQGIRSQAFDIKVKAVNLRHRSSVRSCIGDDILILFEEIGNDCLIAYVPYGPTLKPGDENIGPFLEELSESLRGWLPHNCIMLRYDLLWESLWAKDDFHFDDRGNWMGPPETLKQEFRLNCETRKWNLRKATTNILPSDTLFIDLNKDTDRLLKEMKPKTRYNLRLSLRKGVRVRKADRDEFDAWYSLYRETCLRNKVRFCGRKYFETVLGTAAGCTKSPAEVELLFAEIDDRPLAGMFLAFSNNRATYLYGASSSTDRNYMASYALQWEAICRAKNYGCTEYDMFGIAPYPSPSHPLYGLYRFKTGFGGRIFHRMGCWDYPFAPDKYAMFRATEMKASVAA